MKLRQILRSTNFLRAVLLVVAVAVLGLCLVALPLGIMTDVTGLYRPILIGMYIPAIPFFIALYQSFRLLGSVDAGTSFSESSVQSLRSIKHCAALVSLLYALGMPYIFHAADLDDAPGVVLIGLIIIMASLVIAVFAALLQKLLQNAIDIKSENDLTV